MTVESSHSGLGFNLDKSRAILIGTSRFPRDTESLPDLPAVTLNVTCAIPALLACLQTGFSAS
jgi:hypothetical protein